jgi:hypothetical protein
VGERGAATDVTPSLGRPWASGEGSAGWFVIFEEAGDAGYLLIPSGEIEDPLRTFSILSPTNPAAILELRTTPSGSRELHNLATGATEGTVRPSSVPDHWELTGGTLAARMTAALPRWVRANRRYPPGRYPARFHFQ